MFAYLLAELFTRIFVRVISKGLSDGEIAGLGIRSNQMSDCERFPQIAQDK